MIKSIWDLFNSKYNDASRYTEEETKLAEEVLSDVQTLLELDADKNDYCWHDIRKNPDDVPYKDMRYDKHSEEFSILFDAPKVIGIDKHGQVTGHIEGVNGKYFCARTRNEIVAWKYLEPFEEEDNE